MKLFETIKLGNLNLKNRMVMAPMTRSRANIDGVVGEMTVEYYKQRASAGLIITEGINISEQAIGSPFTPGLFTIEQIKAWKKVTEAVHKQKGLLFAQLWHTGRVGHSIDKNGQLPVAPSAIAIEGQKHFTTKGPMDYEVPKVLTKYEILQIINDYFQAAVNAIDAGFDGVELHGAFGYLPNQFLAESSNQRTDRYGGSLEKRSKFILEIMNGLESFVGKNKVGIKLSPSIPFNSILESDPIETYSHLISELNKLDLAYIHLMQPMFPIDHLPQYPKNVIETYAPLSKNAVIANAGYTKETAEKELQKGFVDLVSFGTAFLANPDLPKRFELNAALNQPDRETLYGGGEKGYTDYPTL
jgi:N-ethylmaleimide reductase